MGALVIKLLTWFSFLCKPRAKFTETELVALGMAYEHSGIPPLAFEQFRNNPVADEHVADLMAVMQGHPDWVVPEYARNILNGMGQWRRVWGYGVYKWLTYESHCQCCIGWRVLLLLSVSFGLGSSVHLLLTKLV
jgi:hypothetical protein